MALFGSIIPPIKSVLNQLFTDPDLAVTVTYKRFKSQTFDKSLGHNVNTYDDVEIPGIRLRHNADSVAVSAASIDVGDQLYMFRNDDAPTDMSLKDLIVDDDGNVLKVKGIDNIFDLAFSVTVEGGRVE